MEIRLEQVEVTFNGHTILKGITTTIPSGTTVTVVGPSGCGKSSFLKLINGLFLPTTGTVRIDGRSLEYSQIHRIRRRMGYVMQEAGLFPHLTIQENLQLLARFEGWEQGRISERIKDLMNLVNLADPRLLARLPSSLSGGQRQRVAIARALMLDPPVLLMDEPFSALDPIVRRELQEEFSRLKRALKKTIVLVTHDFAEAYRLGEKIILLNDGRIEQEAPPEEFIRRPASALVSQFVASARGIPQG